MSAAAPASRIETIAGLLKDGKTYREIARTLGISTQRVGQLVSPVKAAARSAVSTALLSGTLRRPEACEDCGTPGAPHGHHHDYTKPLDVRWLCMKCHMKAHAVGAPEVVQPATVPEIAAALGSRGGRSHGWGRPSLTDQGGDTASFPVRLPAPLVKRLKARSALLGISRAELVRRALEAWLA